MPPQQQAVDVRCNCFCPATDPSMTNTVKYKFTFCFDYGAGGCLWANNEATSRDFGVGPLDLVIKEQLQLPSDNAIQEIMDIDMLHSTYLNKDYPPDPSTWTQEQCDAFNKRIENLIILLRQEFPSFIELIDKQERYVQDPDLDRYLNDPKNFKR